MLNGALLPHATDDRGTDVFKGPRAYIAFESKEWISDLLGELGTKNLKLCAVISQTGEVCEYFRSPDRNLGRDTIRCVLADLAQIVMSIKFVISTRTGIQTNTGGVCLVESV